MPMINTEPSSPPFRENSNIRVLLFGSFDPLHEGHRNLFQQARMVANHLTVVVARDTTIAKQKGHTAFHPEHERLAMVAADPMVDEATLGDENPNSYTSLTAIPFDVLALGYDQTPSDADAGHILNTLQLSHVRIIRLLPHKPDVHKSSLLRT